VNLNITHHSTALDGSAYTDGMADRRGPLTKDELLEAIAAQSRMHDEIDEAIAARWESMKPAEMSSPPPLPEDTARDIWRACAVVAIVLVAFGAFVAYLAGVTP